MAKVKMVDEIPLPFPQPEFAEKWKEWLTYRRERRIASYVPTGLKRTFNRLVLDSGNDYKTAMLMIDQAMEKSWQGIYPLKNNFNAEPTRLTQTKPNPSGNVDSGGFGQL